MHNNYYFLRQLTSQLHGVLNGGIVSACFSQQKDELIVRIETAGGPFFIRVTARPDLSCLSFPRDFARARKNSVDLFPELIGRRIARLRQFENERSMALQFHDDNTLLFKMHGNRANAIHFRGNEPVELFRKNLHADRNLRLSTMDRQIEWSEKAFRQNQDNPSKLYFTFGTLVWRFLRERGFDDSSTDERWRMVRDVIRQLESPKYYITDIDSKPVLCLLEMGRIRSVLASPIDAANAFFPELIHFKEITGLKATLLRQMTSRLEAGQSYCAKAEARLTGLQQEHRYQQWADLIMANLHAIPFGSDSAIVNDFYNEDRPLEIKLRRELTPQDNAALYYRKAKNQSIELRRIQDTLNQKREEIAALQRDIATVEGSDNIATLRELRNKYAGSSGPSDATALPYHEFIFEGYRIWVGKNAQANDVLTLKLAHKDDLWLHAKDVAGSHVVIKRKSGQNFPKRVIERAAELAAYNSRRKTDSLCPVIFTPRKFVRKRKGDPPGAVVVEREEIMMVVPRLEDGLE